MENEYQTELNKNQLREFRRDLKKCVKVLISSDDQEITSKYLDRLTEHIKKQDIYTNYYTFFEKSIASISDEGKEIFESVFNQGINIGMVLTLGALLNNTGCFSDYMFEDDDVEDENEKL